MSILLRIAYDGTGFHGFARQGPDSPLRTVQGTIDAALRRLFKQDVECRGASRTDAGVHARGQLVAFDPPFAIPTRGIMLGLAGLLPKDIAVVACWEQHRDDGEPVNPRFGNLGKHYRYRVYTSSVIDPNLRHNCWHLTRPLDTAAMAEAAAMLQGEHDFASFRGANCQAQTTTRTITEAVVVAHPPADTWPADPTPLSHDTTVVDIHIRGTAFLYKMVRIIVGTLVEVGHHKRPAAAIPQLLSHPDRRRAGPTAPAHGLTLMEVLWAAPSP